MTTVIKLNTDGPRDPQYVLEVAEALSQAVRVLNHLTRARESLEYPSEADSLLRYLSAAAAGFPQLLGQVSRWLSAEQEAGRIEVTGGQYAGQPARAVATAALRLDEAEAYAGNLQVVLGMAASVTSEMAAAEPAPSVPPCPRCGETVPHIAQTAPGAWACTVCGKEWGDDGNE